jgi:hypothetical protein
MAKHKNSKHITGRRTIKNNNYKKSESESLSDSLSDSNNTSDIRKLLDTETPIQNYPKQNNQMFNHGPIMPMQMNNQDIDPLLINTFAPVNNNGSLSNLSQLNSLGKLLGMPQQQMSMPPMAMPHMGNDSLQMSEIAMSPQMSVMSPQMSVMSPQMSVMSPQMSVMSPQMSMGMAPQMSMGMAPQMSMGMAPQMPVMSGGVSSNLRNLAKLA